jgi:hypothetical protein
MQNVSEYVKGLREAADFLEAHGHNFHVGQTTLYIHPQANPKEDAALFAKLAGYVEKSFTGRSDDVFVLRREFSGGVDIKLLTNRANVCERVVVGMKTLAAHDGYTIAAQPEREVEIVEWKCAPILAEAW